MTMFKLIRHQLFVLSMVKIVEMDENVTLQEQLEQDVSFYLTVIKRDIFKDITSGLKINEKS